MLLYKSPSCTDRCISMNHLYRLASTLVIAAAAAILIPATPALAQATAADALTSAAQGNQNNADNLITGHEAIQLAPPLGRDTTYGAAAPGSLGLNTTGTALQAPMSVNTAPFPSGAFTYGFPNEPTTVFTGVSQPGNGNGGYLPATSTSSVDINIVDMPFLRETYTNGGAVGAPNGVNIGLTAGPAAVNATVNPQQLINQLNSWFNGGGNSNGGTATTSQGGTAQ